MTGRDGGPTKLRPGGPDADASHINYTFKSTNFFPSQGQEVVGIL
jgi:hypothetical protein